MSDNEKKEKKKKVTYIDDGRTIVDMSGLRGGYGSDKNLKPRSTAKEKWQTYWAAVRMMFFPMLIVIGILVVTYFIMYFALS